VSMGPSYSGLPLRPSYLAGFGVRGERRSRYFTLRRFFLGGGVCKQGNRRAWQLGTRGWSANSGGRMTTALNFMRVH
jgi:hypothetical protein